MGFAAPADVQGAPALDRLRHALAGLLVVLSLAPGTASDALRAQSVAGEYQVKAAFVSKFPQFAEWPAGALAQRKTFDLCVVRPSPFGRWLVDLVADETYGGRPLTAREVTDPAELGTCQLLFVPELAASERKAWLAKAGGLPVLTVGDHDGFLDEGGIVNLRVIDGRVRFEINPDGAARAGLRLSSQLLRLAVAVRGSPA